MGNLPNPVSLIAVIVALGVAPFAALMVTSYTKLVVVLGLLRSACR
jgi:type III secretion protein R